jgi:hypothetical protein
MGHGHFGHLGTDALPRHPSTRGRNHLAEADSVSYGQPPGPFADAAEYAGLIPPKQVLKFAVNLSATLILLAAAIVADNVPFVSSALSLPADRRWRPRFRFQVSGVSPIETPSLPRRRSGSHPAHLYTSDAARRPKHRRGSSCGVYCPSSAPPASASADPDSGRRGRLRDGSAPARAVAVRDPASQ